MLYAHIYVCVCFVYIFVTHMTLSKHISDKNITIKWEKNKSMNQEAMTSIPPPPTCMQKFSYLTCLHRIHYFIEPKAQSMFKFNTRECFISSFIDKQSKL